MIPYLALKGVHTLASALLVGTGAGSGLSASSLSFWSSANGH